MTREIIIAGFGGQGVMSMGKTLVEAGMEESLEVSWVPSYGPEMRGGTANCSVVLSDLPVGSPVVNRPTELIAMNGPSLKRFEPRCRPGAACPAVCRWQSPRRCCAERSATPPASAPDRHSRRSRAGCGRRRAGNRRWGRR